MISETATETQATTEKAAKKASRGAHGTLGKKMGLTVVSTKGVERNAFGWDRRTPEDVFEASGSGGVALLHQQHRTGRQNAVEINLARLAAPSDSRTDPTRMYCSQNPQTKVQLIRGHYTSIG